LFDTIILLISGLLLSICISALNAISFGQLADHMKSSDAKASKYHLKFSSLMMIFIKLAYLSSVISLK